MPTTFSVAVLLGFASCAALAADGTVIGELAEDMAPGEWAVLMQNNSALSAGIDDTGFAQNTLTYAVEGKWDPGTKTFLFIGGDHNGGTEKFISYSAATNQWKTEPMPPWMNPVPNQNHSYDYMAMDSARGDFYYQHHRYDVASKSWTSLTLSGLKNYLRAHDAYEYFPGKGLVAMGDDRVFILADGGNSWREINGNMNWTNLHVTAEYNSVHDVVIFGGGDNDDTLYKMDANENITPLGNTPIDVISTSSRGTILTHDSVTGDYLVVTNDAQLYQYDVTNDSWTLIDNSVSHFENYFRDNKQNNLIASPISNYGVVLFVQWLGVGENRVWLYKHASGQNLDFMPPAAIDDLQAN